MDHYNWQGSGDNSHHRSRTSNTRHKFGRSTGSIFRTLGLALMNPNNSYYYFDHRGPDETLKHLRTVREIVTLLNYKIKVRWCDREKGIYIKSLWEGEKIQ